MTAAMEAETTTTASLPAAARKHIVRSFDEDLTQLTAKIAEMGALAERQVADALTSLVDRDIEAAARVIERDPQLDALEEQVDQAVVRLLAMRQPMAIDLRVVTMALKVSNDLERAGDYAVSIAKRGQRLAEQPELGAVQRIPQMGEICLEMFKDVLDAYVDRDAKKAMAVFERDKDVDEIYSGLFRELVTYMLEDPRTISRCIDLMFIAKNLERIGDHATNIAEKIHYMIHGAEINRPRHELDG
jgi:phosphate transport system protein